MRARKTVRRRVTKHGIPILRADASWRQCGDYLKWLAESPYNYHIDDDPEDIPTFDEDEAKTLKRNIEIVGKVCEPYGGWAGVWGIYSLYA